MRFRTAIIWNAISQFGQSGITFLSTIILARLLTPDDFGIIGIVTIFISFSQMMVDSEMGGALLRKKEVDRTDYSTLFWYNLIVSLILFGVLYFTAPLIADFYKRQELIDVIRIISTTIIIHAFRVVQRIMLFRDLKFKEYTIINVVSGLISMAIAIILAKNGFGYWSLVWQQVILALCNTSLMELYNRFLPLLSFSKASFKYQFGFGISLLGADIIQTIANNISTNIIAKVATLQFTGYYTQSSRLTNFAQSTIGSIMNQSIFPMMAKMESIQDIRSTYIKFLKYILIVLGVGSVVCIVFAKNIIQIILGKEWIDATWIFQVLSLTIVTTSIQHLCKNVLKSLGMTKLVFKIETVKSVIIIGALFLAVFYGAVAIIWALVFSQFVACIYSVIETNKSFKNIIVRSNL